MSEIASKAELAARVQSVTGKVRKIIMATDLSAAGQAAAIAMVVTMNLEVLERVPAALQEATTDVR